MADQHRGHGEGGLHWEEPRQRWFATIYIGYTPAGRRRKVKIAAKTKTEAKAKLRQLIREQEAGRQPVDRKYTVGQAVEAWLTHGLTGKADQTVQNRVTLATQHVIPSLGRRKLSELTAEEVDEWLTAKARTLSTDTLKRLMGILRASIRRAQARELVQRNVALLCDIPRGTTGRLSKSLTFDQARQLLVAARHHPRMHAYVVLSLLTGARTEELRALSWDHVDLDADPPFVRLWRSVRHGGDTKTPRSRRTLELPSACVEALRAHAKSQLEDKLFAGTDWVETGLVFTSQLGTALDAANVRRMFRKVVADAGLDPSAWTPRELRHSFVSLLSSSGMPIEDIAHLVGHANTRTTEIVYRKELRPVLTRGAVAMDEIFRGTDDEAMPPTLPPGSDRSISRPGNLDLKRQDD